MSRLSLRLRPAAWCAALALAAAALAPVAQAAVPTPSVVPAPAGRPGNASPVDLGPSNTLEREFFVSGLANIYKKEGTWGKDGRWAAAVKTANQPYQTRVLTRFPADPAKFNGTVIVEWFNVSSGFDIEVDAGFMLEELLSQGYAWVGVSAQKVGVEGLKKQQATRYANLSIPTDDLSYDIFSQAAQAVKDQYGQLLGGLKPQRLIAVGQSQSSIRLVTYTNAIQPLAKAFDAIIIHGRGPSGSSISSGESGPAVANIRTDQPTKVFQLQTEFEMSSFFGSSARQPDSATVRNWEIAGASHIDQYLIRLIDIVSASDLGYKPIDCASPPNDFPLYRAVKSVLYSVNRWVVDGTPPPAGKPIEFDAFGFIKRDAYGNVKGGVRLPEIDVPVSNYGTSNIGDPTKGPGVLNTLACFLAGNTKPLSATQLKQLYSSKADYVSKISAAAQKAREAGLLRPGDDAKTVEEAQQRALPLP